jgi:hypothetical protein
MLERTGMFFCETKNVPSEKAYIYKRSTEYIFNAAQDKITSTASA